MARSSRSSSGKARDKTRDKARLPAWRHALVSTATGYVFSLILSALIAVLLMLDLKPVRIVERAGIDLGMRIHASAQPMLDPTFQDPPHRYIFFDLDDGVCRDPPATELWTCPAGEPASPALVRELIRVAGNAGAAVIIVDVVPPRSAADREALIRAASEGAGPLVIAPLVADPAGDRARLLPPQDPLLPVSYARGRLRLAPMTTQIDPKAGDGVIRHYPPFTGVGAQDWPTAPLVAAAWLAGGEARIRIACDSYGVPRSSCAAAAGARPGRVEEARLSRFAQLSSDDLSPLFWTLPQVRSVDADSRNPFDAIFPYVRVSETRTPDGGLSLATDWVRGNLVVIGSSSQRARDLHLTPLGTMSGPEILLNAVRSFLEFGQMRESRSTAGPGEALLTFWAKAAGALLPALLLFPAWWFLHSSRQRTARRRWPLRAATEFAGVLLFGLLLVTGLLIELVPEIFLAREHAMRGTPVDLITPITALGLGVFADVAKSLLVKIEDLMNAGLIYLEAFGRRFLPDSTRSKRGSKE